MTEILPKILARIITLIGEENLQENNFLISEAIKENKKNYDLLFRLATVCAQEKKLNDALTILSSLLNHDSSDARVFYNLGIIHSLMGQHQLALNAYDSALRINPNDIETLVNKGSSCVDVKKYSLAVETLNEVIKKQPDIPEAWSNLAIALNHLRLYSEALAAYDKAVELRSKYYEAWSNRSIPLAELNRYDEALESCNIAIQINNKYSNAYINKGNIFLGLNQYDKAIECYEEALQINQNHAEAWSNKAQVLLRLEHYQAALMCYENAFKIDARLDWCLGNLANTKIYMCNWSNFGEIKKEITNKLQEDMRIIQPFPWLAMTDNEIAHKKCAEIFINARFPPSNLLGKFDKGPIKEKIRIGYYSADFHNHPTAYLMAELFELHDKNKFEIFAFSFGPIKNDEMRKRLANSFDHFIEVGAQTDIETAKLSRELRIDIAVDLKGFTLDSRTGIFSYGAAPIQVNYLGYPGTMQASYIDYIIADRILIPEESVENYSEKIVYMPDTYQVNDRKRLISQKKFDKADYDLPENAFVFCCFNNNFKISPATFSSWMRILNHVEGSVLWLLEDNPSASENLKKMALEHGVKDARLIFAKRVPLADHLARHSKADLFLDTWPYNAHTTTSDALWAGLPLLTMLGKSFAGRVSASLLNAVGVPELISNSQEEYETLAIELGLNPKKLRDIKSKLVNNCFTTSLFNTPLFTLNLENAYIQMIKRYRADFQPDHIFVA